jgi:hypothetical protein
MPDHNYFSSQIWQIADLLKERRAARIAAAVTGQLDVAPSNSPAMSQVVATVAWEEVPISCTRGG